MIEKGLATYSSNADFSGLAVWVQFVSMTLWNNLSLEFISSEILGYIKRVPSVCLCVIFFSLSDVFK